MPCYFLAFLLPGALRRAGRGGAAGRGPDFALFSPPNWAAPGRSSVPPGGLNSVRAQRTELIFAFSWMQTPETGVGPGRLPGPTRAASPWAWVFTARSPCRYCLMTEDCCWCRQPVPLPVPLPERCRPRGAVPQRAPARREQSCPVPVIPARTPARGGVGGAARHQNQGTDDARRRCHPHVYRSARPPG